MAEVTNCSNSNIVVSPDLIYGRKPVGTACQTLEGTCRTVRLFNDTCNQISNLMWLTLFPGSSVGLSIKEWLMLSQNEAVTDLLDNKSLRVEFDAV